MNPQRPGNQNEELPFVAGLVSSAFTQTGTAARMAVTSLSQRTQLFLWGGGTVAVFVGVLVLSLVESPTLVGAARGLGAGLFIALLYAVGAGAVYVSLNRKASPSARRVEEVNTVGELDALLAPTLNELNAVRADVARKVKSWSVVAIPAGMAIAVLLWMLARTGNDPPGFMGLILWIGLGAFGGEALVVTKLDRDYRRLYKNRVLPIIAGRVGNLTYRQASKDDAKKLSAHRILPEFDRIEAEDEISGTHRGLALRIVETKLRRRSGKKSRVVFNGLVIELTLPRSLTGTTAVLTDAGTFGNLKSRWRSGAMEPVRLEDPMFERQFEVFSNDQVEARALLTPSFMERFVALAQGSGWLPGALAEGSRLSIALPNREGSNLFEPPVYWKPAGGEVLRTLERDIQSVLRMADAVIELDFWAAGRSRDSASPAAEQPMRIT